MAVSTDDFINFARDSISNCSTSSSVEIDLRNAVSRAYYGLYHAALVYANTVSVIPVGDYLGSTHKKLSDFFQQCSHSDAELKRLHKRVGYSLKQLHAKRCSADYEIYDEFPYSDAVAHLKRCEEQLAIIFRLSESLAA